MRARVDGTVQGVGFRPYVFRLAEELGLDGFVANDERGVLLEVEGDGAAVERFLARLPDEAPALATVEAVRAEPVPAAGAGSGGFRIVESVHGGTAAALVSPDTATCDACLAELRDPTDRRHRYPFINCTDCGPRFTIVRGVPYDRPLTTMAAFAMCDACQAEYDDPRAHPPAPRGGRRGSAQRPVSPVIAAAAIAPRRLACATSTAWRSPPPVTPARRRSRRARGGRGTRSPGPPGCAGCARSG